jgi:hypothetical protein
MKKVDFGFANESNPNGTFEGIGLAGEARGPVSAEFIDVVRLNNCDYLITRITETFKNSENEIGKIDVRRAFADLFPDGSAIMYLDQNHSADCFKLEELLNTENAKILLDKGISVKEICGGYNAPLSFLGAINGNLIMATAIRHDVFEEKRALVSRCHHSFSEMRREIESMQIENNRERGRTF